MNESIWFQDLINTFNLQCKLLVALRPHAQHFPCDHVAVPHSNLIGGLSGRDGKVACSIGSSVTNMHSKMLLAFLVTWMDTHSFFHNQTIQARGDSDVAFTKNVSVYHEILLF